MFTYSLKFLSEIAIKPQQM